MKRRNKAWTRRIKAISNYLYLPLKLRLLGTAWCHLLRKLFFSSWAKTFRKAVRAGWATDLTWVRRSGVTEVLHGHAVLSSFLQREQWHRNQHCRPSVWDQGPPIANPSVARHAPCWATLDRAEGRSGTISTRWPLGSMLYLKHAGEQYRMFLRINIWSHIP